jgi:aarF domain-containing kinase
MQRVLTAEYIDGFKISDLQRIEREKLDLADIDAKLFKMFSEQIFRTGFVHADPHPGNGWKKFEIFNYF